MERHWGLRATTLDYLQVGFGSHHWRAADARGTRRFVTVDDLEAGFQPGSDTDSTFGALDRAFRTAAVLRNEANLEFVVAPLPDDEGEVIRRISDRYAVTLSPLVQGVAIMYGSYKSPDDRRRMGTILGRLHAATEQVPQDLRRREDFALPSRSILLNALHDLDRPWSSGPFVEPVRQLLQINATDIERRLQEYDELAVHVHGRADWWVVTHGEPHAANVITDLRADVHLVDWDTTLIAPRERDLRMVLDRELTGLDEYVGVVGDVSSNEEVLQLYSSWWDLAEIATYTALFRRSHGRTEDTVKSWKKLAELLPGS